MCPSESGLLLDVFLREEQIHDLEELISRLSRLDLLSLRGLIDDRLAELEEEESQEAESSQEPKGKKSQGGYVELKMIQGYGPYAYLRWRDGKRLRSKYLGKVAKPGAGSES